jgi:hypothetical protein
VGMCIAMKVCMNNIQTALTLGGPTGRILKRLKGLVLLAPIGIGLIGVCSSLQGCALVTRDPIVTNDQSDLHGQKKPPVKQDPYNVSPAPYGTDLYDTDPYGTDPYGTDPYGTDPYGQ